MTTKLRTPVEIATEIADSLTDEEDYWGTSDAVLGVIERRDREIARALLEACPARSTDPDHAPRSCIYCYWVYPWLRDNGLLDEEPMS